jgi:hypothetical protein
VQVAVQLDDGRLGDGRLAHRHAAR